MSTHDADVAVIGAGILGLSTAMALATKHAGLRVVSLEQESGVGRHQSGNNSGVIHSGLYYRPGSAKARMAVAGAERMYAFCAEHGIGAERCGKVVVATHESELERMRELQRRGDANGVPDIRELGPDELREFEPNAAGVAALHIPSTGIADYRGVCEKYRELLESAGGSVRLRSRVSGVRVESDGVELATTTGVVRAKYAVNCAGLQADRIARRAGGVGGSRPADRAVSRRVLRPGAVGSGDAQEPDLSGARPGVSVSGRAFHAAAGWVGRGGAERGAGAQAGGLPLARRIAVRDAAESLSWPGFLRLARDHWQTGLGEVWRSANKSAFVKALQRLMPGLEADQLVRGGAGVRAQALRRDGSLADDFEIARQDRMIHVLNAPSPGATASLLIGEEIASTAESAWLGRLRCWRVGITIPIWSDAFLDEDIREQDEYKDLVDNSAGFDAFVDCCSRSAWRNRRRPFTGCRDKHRSRHCPNTRIAWLDSPATGAQPDNH